MHTQTGDTPGSFRQQGGMVSPAITFRIFRHGRRFSHAQVRGLQYTGSARHLGRSHSTAIEGDRHETRSDDFTRRCGLGLRRSAATRQRACRERLQAISATCQPAQARDPSPRASQNRATGGHDDLRDGTARRIPEALLPNAALRGLGFGRGRDLARRTTPRAGGRYRAQSTSAGCSPTAHAAGQDTSSSGLRGADANAFLHLNGRGTACA